MTAILFEGYVGVHFIYLPQSLDARIEAYLFLLYLEDIYVLARTTIRKFCNMHCSKVPAVDPPIENSSQPKKFVIK